MKKNLVIEGTKANIAKLEALCALCDIKLVELEAETPKAQPKAVKQTSKKSDDSFPRKEYLAMGKELGCLSKKGTVWNSCRSIVYDAIGWNPETKAVGKPKLTKAQAKKAVDKVKKDNGWK